MFNKHKNRILNNKIEKPCVFSFFDKKGYIIMLFMMTGGITLRSLDIVNQQYLSTFYMGLGPALFLGGLCFLIYYTNHFVIKKYIR